MDLIQYLVFWILTINLWHQIMVITILLYFSELLLNFLLILTSTTFDDDEIINIYCDYSVHLLSLIHLKCFFAWFYTTALSIIVIFQAYGPIYQLNILRDKSTGVSRGCCFITYYKRKDSLAAQNATHNIKILPGVSFIS